VVFERQDFHGRSGGLLSPSARTVRLGDNSNDLMRGRQESTQRRAGEGCRTHKEKSHVPLPTPLAVLMLTLGALILALDQIAPNRAHTVKE
jgi:hypothetical protein